MNDFYIDEKGDEIVSYTIRCTNFRYISAQRKKSRIPEVPTRNSTPIVPSARQTVLFVRWLRNSVHGQMTSYSCDQLSLVTVVAGFTKNMQPASSPQSLLRLKQPPVREPECPRRVASRLPIPKERRERQSVRRIGSNMLVHRPDSLGGRRELWFYDHQQ